MMSKQERIDRYVDYHAARYMNGLPRPLARQAEKELGIGSHTAYEILDRISNKAANAWTWALSPFANPEPVPEWSR